MHLKLIALSILAIVCHLGVHGAKPEPTETFANQLELQTPGLSYLYWKAVKNESVTFEIHFKNSSKWFLFGLNGAAYSDVIVAWVNTDGTGHFSDRKLFRNPAKNEMTTSIDKEQNWRLIDAFVSDDYNVVKFTRPNKITQCNTQNTDDLDIAEGLNTLIFVGGNSPNLDDNSIPIASATTATVQANILNGATGPFGCIPTQKKAVFTSVPLDNYSNKVDLIDGILRLYWNFTGTDIIGEVHCKTLGWVSFGISPNGGMDGSDVFVGWIDSNSKVNFTDRYISLRSVLVDNSQDWTLLNSKQTDEFTIFQFKRAIVACDSQDLTITVEAPNVIYAYGTSDPAAGADITYHGSNRGSKKVNLIGVNKINNAVPNSETLEFSLGNVVLPKEDTFYYCRGFKIPSTLTPKRHIYKWELEFAEYKIMDMHHVVIHECESSYDGSTPNYEMNCDKNMDFLMKCNIISNTWAVGGDFTQYFPENTGYPIGGDTDYKYIFIQVHYNNPDKSIGYIEKLTLRYYMTSVLRQNELSILVLGTDPSPYGIALPPQVANFQIQTYCDSNCIGKNLQTQNLTVVSILPHTHTTGVGIYTKIIRNGSDIGYLINNDRYDFNYQSSYILNPPAIITKDDQLITRCTYNTMKKSTFTLGGHSTNEEMCFQFLTVYPRINKFRTCFSFPSYEKYIDLLNDLAKTGDTNMKPIVNYTFPNLLEGFVPTFTSLASKPVSDSVRNRFSNFFNTTTYSESCSADFFPGPFNQIKASNSYVPPDNCKQSNTTTTRPVIPSGPPIAQIAQTFVNIFNWILAIFRRF